MGLEEVIPGLIMFGFLVAILALFHGVGLGWGIRVRLARIYGSETVPVEWIDNKRLQELVKEIRFHEDTRQIVKGVPSLEDDIDQKEKEIDAEISKVLKARTSPSVKGPTGWIVRNYYRWIPFS